MRSASVVSFSRRVDRRDISSPRPAPDVPLSVGALHRGRLSDLQVVEDDALEEIGDQVLILLVLASARSASTRSSERGYGAPLNLYRFEQLPERPVHRVLAQSLLQPGT